MQSLRHSGSLRLRSDTRSHRPLRSARLRIDAMFTGIVQGMATVDQVARKDNFSSVGIRFPEGRVHGIQIGASVAINGTCLTVTEINGDALSFDIMVRAGQGLVEAQSYVAVVGEDRSSCGPIHCTNHLSCVHNCLHHQVETLRATNLGGLEAGTKVNFERSARVGDEIGGHNVSGHVHVTGVDWCYGSQVWTCVTGYRCGVVLQRG